MKKIIISCLIFFSVTGIVNADTESISFNLGTTINNNIDTLDIRAHQQLDRTDFHYSIAFLWDRMLSENIPSAMLGLGFQYPRLQKSPYFYGLNGYVLFENKRCDYGNKDQQETCIDNKISPSLNGNGSYAIIQPEIGLRFKIKRGLWATSSLRYWWSNENSLNNHVGLLVGLQF